jgi:hypothetical protein
VNPDSAATPAAAETLLEALQACGIQLRSERDGSLQARAERVELRNVALQTLFGALDAATVTLLDVALHLHAAAHPSLDLLGLSIAEMRVEDAELTPALDAVPPATVRLEPLGTVQGRLQVAIRDARWLIDADITLPVVAGRIDFDRVIVEHIGPNSALGISRDALYVEAPSCERTVLVAFSRPDLPGVRYEARGGFAGLRVADRGSVDLRPFAEAVLRAGPADAPWREPDREVQAMLERTKLAGDLQLADGVIGTEHHHLVLDGAAEGRNGLALSAAALGERLVIRWPALSASHALVALQGRSGVTGAVEAALEAHLDGLSGDAPQLAVKIHRMTVRDIAIE